MQHDEICKLIDDMFKEQPKLPKQKAKEIKPEIVESKRKLPISNIFFAIASILIIVMAGSAVVYVETPSDSTDELLKELESQGFEKPLTMDEKFMRWMKDVELEISDYNKHILKGFDEENYEVIEYWASQLESWVISQEDVQYDVSDEYKPIQESYYLYLQYTEYKAYCLKKVAKALQVISQ